MATSIIQETTDYLGNFALSNERHAEDSCPIHAKNALMRARVEHACSAAQQIEILMGALLDEIKGAYADDAECVPRALYARARHLAVAAQLLLGGGDGEAEDIQRAAREVAHG